MSGYPMVITPLTEEDGGGYFVFFPDLPGCVSDGESYEEAVANGTDALQVWLEVQEAREAAIPEPNSQAAEQEEQFEAMAHAIARLSSDLEKAEARIAELEAAAHPGASAHTWQFRGLAHTATSKTRSKKTVPSLTGFIPRSLAHC